MSTPLNDPQAQPAITGPPGSIAAVLWDMDGTLVDTEPYWIATEFDLVESFGGSWSHEHAMNLVGNELTTSAAYIQDHGGVPLDVDDIVERLLDGVVAKVREEIPWRPGARELLDELGRAGVPTALVTMSYRRLADEIVAQLGEFGFDVLVTGDSVTHGKPDPEPYLLAAKLLGVDPAQCVAIEDSSTGATSAAAAGCSTLVVPHHVPVSAGTGRVFADTLEGMDLSALGQVHAQGQESHRLG